MPSTRIEDFDTWRPGYGLASVSVLRAGTGILADIFTDEELTAPADNPQTLLELVEGGISYGKLAVPIYVGVPFYLLSGSIDATGVIRPALSTLEGEDASLALVTVTGGNEAVALQDSLARRIDVRDFGEFIAVGGVGASASTNNATLVTAIAVVASQGAGYLELPAGTYQVTQFTIPQGVVLRGAGRGATVLQSTVAGNVVTIGGPRAGFTRMTLDGVTLVALSVGVYAVNKDQIVLDDAEIKRFETGLYRRGGSVSEWFGLYISNCVTGYKAHGDSASKAGGALRFNQWTGGTVELCSTAGIELKNVDAVCEHNVFTAIDFDTNTGTAVNIVGARASYFFDCGWTGNTTNIAVADASPASATNTVVGLEFSGGEMDNGSLAFSGTYRDVVFRRMTLASVTIAIAAPGQNIPFEDCQVSSPTVSGVPTCVIYRETRNHGASFLLTTDLVAHKAWGLTLTSGQKVYLEAKVIGRQRNGINTGFYHIAVSAGRVGASLAYDTQVANFTVGEVLTGGTSGATARITADSDSGVTGTLTIQDVVGAFVDNEIITDPLGGNATANGTISESAAALIGSVTAIRAAQETDAAWNATFVANGPQIELQVNGDTVTAQTVEWTVDVDVIADQATLLIVAQALKAQFPYHARTGTFTYGMFITGLTSGASGFVLSDVPNGGNGVLTLGATSGAFIVNEIISNGRTVSALYGPA